MSTSPETTALVVLGVPFAWSAALTLLRRSAESPDDVTEKRLLTTMLAPVVLGVALLCLVPWLPTGVALMPSGLDDMGKALIAPASAVSHPATAHTSTPFPFIHWLAVAALVVCAAGAVLQIARLVVAVFRLGRIVSAAAPDAALGNDVRVTARSIPPLAWGRTAVVLPQSLLAQVQPDQMAMILHHEREHLRRGDTGYFVLLSAIDALFWFNPFVLRQTRSCRLAAELACDAAVTQSVPEARATYAALLVDALRHIAFNTSSTPMPTVFPSEELGDYQMRLNAIMRPDSGRPKPKRILQYAIIALAAVPIAFTQFAWSQNSAPAPVAPPVQPANVVAKPDPISSAATSAVPVIKPQSRGNFRPVPKKISNVQTAPIDTTAVHFTFEPVAGSRGSGFGVHVDPFTGKPALHDGLDYNVAVGTAVLAAAPGTVSFVGVRDGYGEVVEIDHGNNMLTRYAHLDSAEVTAGTVVTAGREIGKSGSSGRSTGPHLHFEVWKNSLPIDPATVLPAA